MARWGTILVGQDSRLESIVRAYFAIKAMYF